MLGLFRAEKGVLHIQEYVCPDLTIISYTYGWRYHRRQVRLSSQYLDVFKPHWPDDEDGNIRIDLRLVRCVSSTHIELIA